nr:MAG TPA: hypothetical protein [Caudoviricetes sp.]
MLYSSLNCYLTREKFLPTTSIFDSSRVLIREDGEKFPSPNTHANFTYPFLRC